MTKFWIITTLLAIFFGVIGVFGFNTYSNFYTPPADAPTGQYTFTVEEGDTLGVIAQKLEDDNVISSRGAFMIQEQLNPILPLQTGQYTIQLNNENPEEILRLIDTETRRLQAQITDNQKPTVRVTIREGLTADQVFAILEENGLVTASEMAETAKDPSNFDRQLYPFLPEPLDCQYGDIKNCAKYYIEGFLYPNTYDFFVPSTPDEIYKKFLDTFNTLVWQRVGGDLNGQDFQQAIIMASIVEKETGRTKTGITDQNREEVNEERRNVAGVFYNRIDNNMRWETNPTVDYGTGRRLCEQTLELENCLFLDSPEVQTLYNTYRITGYPIGPITSPEYNNVLATLNPNQNDYLFFVSDATGKTYFASTNFEHEQNIQNVQQINRDLGV